MRLLPQPQLERLLSGTEPWLFLSPHLDDAVLSCGALIASQARRRNILVMTLFTECSPAPHTKAAKTFLRQCSAQDAKSLYEARKREDAAALAGLGVQSHHLGATDALFRRRRPQVPPIISAFGAAVPELVHLYPTYRFDIALGRVSRADTALMQDLREKISRQITALGVGLVFCPLGVGMHVDHLITRSVGEESTLRPIFYSDFPYNLRNRTDAAFLRSRNLAEWQWREDLQVKSLHIRQYATQVAALFPGDHIPLVPEIYYTRDGDDLPS